MKAFLKNYRQSPRKVRVVAGLVRGKNVDTAMTSLNFLAKRAGDPVKKLLASAVANAKNMGIERENLIIKEIRVDKGIVMKRMMPAAMGTGHRINKRTSHITIVLAEKGSVIVKAGKKNKEEKKAEAKPVAAKAEAAPKKTRVAKAKAVK
ncbi:MAG: 50S ribosomal protein L22 [bacterium]